MAIPWVDSRGFVEAAGKEKESLMEHALCPLYASAVSLDADGEPGSTERERAEERIGTSIEDLGYEM
jgi:hypothetical protein